MCSLQDVQHLVEDARAHRPACTTFLSHAIRIYRETGEALTYGEAQESWDEEQLRNDPEAARWVASELRPTPEGM